MKVLFLSRLYAPHIGGVEFHIQKLCQELGNDFEVTVVTEQHDPSLALSEKVGGVTVLRIALPNQKTNKLAIWRWWLTHFSLLLKSDIIHIHDVFFWLLPFRPFLLWKKVFMTFHGYEGIHNPNSKQKFWHQIADLMSEGNICIGGFHQKWFGVNPTVISYGAVEKTLKKPVKESQLFPTAGTKTAPLRILFVGRLASDTGILVYLEAFKVLQERYHVTLDIYGDGPERGLVEQCISEYKLKAVLHGFVKQAEVPWKEYQLAFVSRYLSLLESFMAGLPVIAQYNVAIKRDYLVLTPFKNWIKVGQTPQEVVAACETWNVSDISKLTTAAQSWAEEQSWAKLAENYKDLWLKKI